MYEGESFLVDFSRVAGLGWKIGMNSLAGRVPSIGHKCLYVFLFLSNDLRLTFLPWQEGGGTCTGLLVAFVQREGSVVCVCCFCFLVCPCFIFSLVLEAVSVGQNIRQ